MDHLEEVDVFGGDQNAPVEGMGAILGLQRTRKLELVEMSRLGSGVMTTHYRQG